jgi:DNA mismatch endonuclease (patch repair protein)
MTERYRLHPRAMIGKPDIVFAKKQLAVFVDSDFWHGRALVEGDVDTFEAIVRGNERWIAKLKRNVERDREVTDALESACWRVLRIWESQVLADVRAAANRVEAALGR